jgi:hypothetical protein
MMGSPRQLENAVPTSRNPHGVWVWSRNVFVEPESESVFRRKNCELIIQLISVKEKSSSNKDISKVTKFNNHDIDTTNKNHFVLIYVVLQYEIPIKDMKMTMVDY